MISLGLEQGAPPTLFFFFYVVLCVCLFACTSKCCCCGMPGSCSLLVGWRLVVSVVFAALFWLVCGFQAEGKKGSRDGGFCGG